MQDASCACNVEEWSAVVGFEGWYEVSCLGRIRRIKAYSGAQSGRPLLNDGNLKPCLARHGYLVTSLYSGTNTSGVRRYVHDLVTAAFLGPKPPRFTVNHRDGNKLNNALSNLEYVSRGENVRHAYRLGLCPSVRLSDEQVIEARQLRATMTFPQLVERYGVSYNTVFRAVHGKTHKHLN